MDKHKLHLTAKVFYYFFCIFQWTVYISNLESSLNLQACPLEKQPYRSTVNAYYDLCLRFLLGGAL